MKRLLVGNISVDVSEDGIRTLFSGTKGLITSVSIPVDPKTGKNRGYALVDMNSALEAEQAVKDLNGKAVEGRSMAISLMEKPKEKGKWYKFGAR